MQTNTIDIQQLADLLEESEILSMDDFGGVRQYVLTWNRQDILVHAGTAGAFVTYGPECFDLEMAGSTHDHARAANNENATA